MMSMPTSSAPIDAGASKRLQAGLQAVAQALAAASLTALAQAIAKDESTACRIRSEECKVSLSDAVRLLYAAGIKCVPVDRVCVDGATYQALTTIAAKAMARPEVVQQLVWDGAE